MNRPPGGDFKIGGDELMLDILELQMKSKKKVFGIYIGNYETYTRYFRVADEKRSQGAIAFLNSLKGAIYKKNLGNHDLKKHCELNKT